MISISLILHNTLKHIINIPSWQGINGDWAKNGAQGINRGNTVVMTIEF